MFSAASSYWLEFTALAMMGVGRDKRIPVVYEDVDSAETLWPVGVVVEDGEIEDGEVEDGEVEDGEVEDGEVEDGEVGDSEAEDGEIEDGEDIGRTLELRLRL